MAANLMFDLDAINLSDTVRDGGGQYLGELIATFGLMMLIFSLVRTGQALVASAVAAYIGGAYWFTSSTSFANPAVGHSDTVGHLRRYPSRFGTDVHRDAVAGALLAVAARALYPDDAETGAS